VRARHACVRAVRCGDGRAGWGGQRTAEAGRVRAYLLPLLLMSSIEGQLGDGAAIPPLLLPGACLQLRIHI